MIRSVANWLSKRFLNMQQKHPFDQAIAEDVVRLLTAHKSFKHNPYERLLDKTFVVFDTETTGFHPYGGDELLSIGAVVVENGQVCYHKTFFEWINPKRSIPFEIQELLHITDAEVADAPNAMEVIRNFIQFIGPACLVAHNLEFDLHFLNRHLTLNCKEKIRNPAIDTLPLAYHMFPTLPSHNLDTLLTSFHIQMRRRHHALDDAVMTAELFVEFIQCLDERGIHSLLGLEHYIRMKATQYGSL